MRPAQSDSSHRAAWNGGRTFVKTATATNKRASRSLELRPLALALALAVDRVVALLLPPPLR